MKIILATLASFSFFAVRSSSAVAVAGAGLAERAGGMDCRVKESGTYAYTCPTTIPDFPRCKVARELKGGEGVVLPCSVKGQQINSTSLWYRIYGEDDYVSSAYLGICTRIAVPDCSQIQS